MKPDLSILIPTRNRANYLLFAIKSALECEGNIEIIVSENHGSDQGWEVCNSFKDSRLTTIQPPAPLTMAANYNFLVQRALGEWVTIIGDDDAILPYATKILLEATTIYPSCEAIVSPRAYYQWKTSDGQGRQGARFGAAFSNESILEDSKKDLSSALNGQLAFIYLPQIYSGGFHRRTLIDRVRRLQGGNYFNSYSPDAYSALAGVLQTPRYLRIGVPLTLVGSSPQSIRSHTKESAQVFSDITTEGYEYSPIIKTDHLYYYGFGFWFYDALHFGTSIGSTQYLNNLFLKHIFYRAYIDFISSNNAQVAEELARYLNFSPIEPKELEDYQTKFPRITRDPVFDSLGQHYEQIGDLSGGSTSGSILDMVELCAQTFKKGKYSLKDNLTSQRL